VERVASAAVAVLLASFVGLVPAHALAGDDQRRQRRDRYEDRWDRWEDRRDRQEDRRDRQEDRWDRRDARTAYWDPARDYRYDSRTRGRRMGRNDRVYRGSDGRYYCERDNGTTGLVIGGMAGGVLGNIIAPGGSKTLGTIIGAGAGALIGKAIDDGDVVCR
jgi:hypothetical protein